MPTEMLEDAANAPSIFETVLAACMGQMLSEAAPSSDFLETSLTIADDDDNRWPFPRGPTRDDTERRALL